MTYMFKLARRMARVRYAALVPLSLAFALACSNSEPTGVGDLAPPAPAAPNPADTPPASPNVGAHPNLPAGFTPIAQNGFAGDNVPTSSSAGVWTDVAWHPEYVVSRVPDPNPLGTPYVTKTIWPRGLRSGESPLKFEGWDHGSDYGRNTRYRKVYVSFVAKIPTRDFENQNTGTKLWYLAHGNTAQQNADFLMLGGTYRGTSVQNAMQIVMYISPADEAVSPGSVAYHQNVDTDARFTCGEWHQVEVYMEQGTIGRSDGTLRVWIDGVKVTDYTRQVKFLDAAHGFTQGFYGFQWTPVWGGVGGTKNRTDALLLNNLFIAGAN